MLSRNGDEVVWHGGAAVVKPGARSDNTESGRTFFTSGTKHELAAPRFRAVALFFGVKRCAEKDQASTFVNSLSESGVPLLGDVLADLSAPSIVVSSGQDACHGVQQHEILAS